MSGPIERGLLSGPIERGVVSASAPIDRALYSGIIEKESSTSKLQKSLSHGSFGMDDKEVKNKKRNIIKSIKRAISNTISRGKNH